MDRGNSFQDILEKKEALGYLERVYSSTLLCFIKVLYGLRE